MFRTFSNDQSRADISHWIRQAPEKASPSDLRSECARSKSRLSSSVEREQVNRAQERSACALQWLGVHFKLQGKRSIRALSSSTNPCQEALLPQEEDAFHADAQGGDGRRGGGSHRRHLRPGQAGSARGQACKGKDIAWLSPCFASANK